MFRVWAIIVVTATVARADDWPRFMGIRGDGRSNETGLQRSWPKEGPPKLWEITTGSGYAGPSVAQGRVFLFHRVGDEEILDCLEAASGRPIWRYAAPTGYVDDFEFDDGPRGVPTIVGEQVFALGAEGRLLCCAFATGKLLWQRELQKDYPFRKGYFGVGVSPVVEGDIVVVNVGARDAGVVAFDRRTGEERWWAGQDAASYSTPIVANVQGQKRLIVLTRQGLLVLNPENGQIIHQRPFRARIDASVNAASPIVADDHIFLSASYGVGALQLNTRDWSAVWKGDSLECHYNTPVLVAGNLYGSHGRQEAGASLRCVDWKTGQLRWEKEGFGCSWLIAADGMLIAVRETGEITLLEATPQAYRERSSFRAFEVGRHRSQALRAAPAFADGILYVRGPRKLSAWNLK